VGLHERIVRLLRGLSKGFPSCLELHGAEPATTVIQLPTLRRHLVGVEAAATVFSRRVSPFGTPRTPFIARGRKVEQAVDDHECNHYTSGTELVDDFACKERRMSDQRCRICTSSRRNASCRSAGACRLYGDPH
jgi:hypothetical protein